MVLQGHIQTPALLCSLWGRISITCTWCSALQRASRRAHFSNNNFHGLMNGQCFASTYSLASHSKPKGGLDTLLEGHKPAAFPGDTFSASATPSSSFGAIQIWQPSCQWAQKSITQLWHPHNQWTLCKNVFYALVKKSEPAGGLNFLNCSSLEFPQWSSVA